MFLFWFIMTTKLFTFQLQQDCLHIVRSNKAVRRFLGAIVDDLPAAQNVGSLLTPEYTIPPVDNLTQIQVDSQWEIMLFIGKPKGRSRMISNASWQPVRDYPTQHRELSAH